MRGTEYSNTEAKEGMHAMFLWAPRPKIALPTTQKALCAPSSNDVILVRRARLAGSRVALSASKRSWDPVNAWMWYIRRRCSTLRRRGCCSFAPL